MHGEIIFLLEEIVYSRDLDNGKTNILFESNLLLQRDK